MKKLTLWLLALCLVLTLMPGSVAGAAKPAEQSTICLEDGTRILVTLEAVESRASGSTTGSKTYTYQSDDGESLWAVKVTGTFLYTGTSAVCTSSTCTVTIYNSAWYTVSKSASESDNTATASATLGRKHSGTTAETKTCTVNLSCDRNGNLY